MGFPKLELGMSAMLKDDLADNLAYNSLKVHILFSYKITIFVSFLVIVMFSYIFIIRA
jgi:hypothetical protein